MADLHTVGDGLGNYIDTSLTCEGTPSGSYCAFVCEAGNTPSAPALCTAGQWAVQTCNDIDACVDYPCGISYNCTDRSATSGGLNNANGRTCVAWTCIAQDANQLAALGYTAAAADATTVPALGTIGCATGYMRALSSVAPTVNCTANGAQYSFSGCVPSSCSGLPAFLQGFNLTGITLPTLPAHSAVSGLGSCSPNRLTSGTQALVVRCDNTGTYVKDTGDIVCAPCSSVTNAATSASYSCTSAQNSRVSSCAPAHFLVPGNNDVGATIANEDSSDRCLACSTVAHSANGATISCTSAADSRISACTLGNYRVAGQDSSTADVCPACTAVANKAPAAMLNCTDENNTRVTACATGYILAPAQSVDTADSCWTTPPSVRLQYDNDYAAVTSSATAFADFKDLFKQQLASFLSIVASRIQISAVASGSVVVYFYVTPPLPSDPNNVKTTSESYAYLTATAANGLLASTFSGVTYDATLLLPSAIPTGYVPPPPPPPPVACSSLQSLQECLSNQCAWETSTPRCTSVAESLALQERESLLLIYFVVACVLAATVLAVCSCYATKVCCFRLTPIKRLIVPDDVLHGVLRSQPARSSLSDETDSLKPASSTSGARNKVHPAPERASGEGINYDEFKSIVTSS